MPHTFGLSMIVKDASTIIGRILDNVNGIFDQVVVVDTGSTDGTIQLLQTKYPFVQIEHFEWCFDFSRARNYALSFMKADTWMWLDSDDTFTSAGARAWRDAAEELASKQVKGSHVALPYYYQVDERDQPVRIQYRERIFLGTSAEWEWHGAVHEVCEYIGQGESQYTVIDAPVIHKPLRQEEVASKRNEDILERAYQAGDRSPRTLYYLARTAIGHEDFNRGAVLARELVESHPGEPFEYEGGVSLGFSHLSLFRKTKNQDQWQRAVEALTNAIAFDPRRNEARTLMVEAYEDVQDYERAKEEASKLSVDVPQTPSTLEMRYYGAYRFELLAEINMRYLNKAEEAWQAHLEAMRSARPSATSLETHRALLHYVKTNGVAVVYIENPNGADAAKQELMNKGFQSVWISNHPSARVFSRQCGPNGFALLAR